MGGSSIGLVISRNQWIDIVYTVLYLFIHSIYMSISMWHGINHKLSNKPQWMHSRHRDHIMDELTYIGMGRKLVLKQAGRRGVEAQDHGRHGRRVEKAIALS